MSVEPNLDFDHAAYDAEIAKGGSGAAARAHLAGGNPIYYSKDDTPSKMVLKEYPSGKIELVTFNVNSGEEILVKVLNP